MEDKDKKAAIWPELQTYRTGLEIRVSTNYRFDYEGKKYSIAISSSSKRGQVHSPYSDEDFENLKSEFKKDVHTFFVGIGNVMPKYSKKYLINHPNTTLISDAENFDKRPDN